MNTALVLLTIFSMLLTMAAVSAAVIGVRRMQITGRAATALPGTGQPVAEVLWQVREVSESPHLRFITTAQTTSTDLVLIKIEETLAALPPGHRELARLQGVELATARAARSAVVDNLAALPHTAQRDLAQRVAQGLVRAMSGGKELPAGQEHLRRAITASASTGVPPLPSGRPSMVDQALVQVQSWLNQFGARGSTPAGSSVLAQLADAGAGLANDLVARGRGGASPEARRLIAALADLGEQVTPAYLWQVSAYSESALQNTTAAVHRLESELAARQRRDRIRRVLWPTIGDRVAENTLARGRSVLSHEHQAHRQLSAAMHELSQAAPQVRGAVWALMLRELPPGAIDGPDLRPVTPALESYLASGRSRR